MTTTTQSHVRVYRDGKLLVERALTDSMTIGRHEDADIQLEDPQMSRFHAAIRREDGRVVIVDNKSLNGTFLNGKPVHDPMEVRDGMVATVAGFQIGFHLDEEDGVGDTVVSGATVVTAPPPAPSTPSAEEEPPPESPLLDHLVEGRKEIPIWSKGDVELKIADIIEETADVKTFRLVGDSPMLFSYKPGQFVTLLLEIDGKKVRRSYSISSTPSRPHTLELTVKRVYKGLVSNWMCDELKLGDTLRMRGPSGRFSCFTYPSRKIMCISAGSGVTPLMSMCRWIIDTAADVDVIKLVSCRTPDDIIFRNEIQSMSARHSGFRVFMTMTQGWKRSNPWTGLAGRIDARMLEIVAPDLHDRHVFMCGPEPFMDAVKASLRKLDFPMENLHVESFGTGRVAKGTPVEPQDVPKRSDPVPEILIRPPAEDGAEPAEVASVAHVSAPEAAAEAATDADSVAPGEVSKVEPAPSAGAYAVAFSGTDVPPTTVQTDGEGSLLDLAEVNGVEIPYACRTGDCGSCLVICKEGDVEMSAEECEEPCIEDDQVKEGYVLACIAYPRSSCSIEVPED